MGHSRRSTTIAAMDRRRAAAALVVVTVIVMGCGDPSPSPSGPGASPSLPDGSPVGPTASASASASADPSMPSATVAWAPLTAGGETPEGRSGHTWTGDPSDAAAYLFGGAGASGALGDLWRYDFGADAWKRRTPDGPAPPARSGHTAVLVDDVGLVILGGTGGDGAVLDDAWVYDPLANTWTALAIAGDRPPARTDACAAVGPDGRLWMTHGFGDGGTALPDVWALDPASRSWTRIEPDGAGPGARGAHGCWWTVDGRLVVHGGRSETTVFGDTWAVDGVVDGSQSGTWSSVETGDAVARSDFGSTLASDRIVMVAGAGGDRLPRADVEALSPGSLAIESFVASEGEPDPRIGTAIVDDPGNERSLLFGGAVDGRPTNELWSFDLR